MNAKLQAGPALRRITFLSLAVLELFYVKRRHHFGRVLAAAAHHSIGTSILTGTAAAPVAPSWDAALGYAWAYGKAIWPVIVLGLRSSA